MYSKKRNGIGATLAITSRRFKSSLPLKKKERHYLRSRSSKDSLKTCLITNWKPCAPTKVASSYPRNSQSLWRGRYQASAHYTVPSTTTIKRIKKHKYLRFFYSKALSSQVVLLASVVCFDIFRSWLNPTFSCNDSCLGFRFKLDTL